MIPSKQAAAVPARRPITIPPQPYKVTSSQLRPSGERVSEWALMLPDNATLDDLLRPEVWAGVAGTFQPRETHKKGAFHRISVWPSDGSFYAELVVRYAGAAEVKVGIINRTDFAPVEVEPVEGPYKADHKGFGRWRVLDTRTNSIVCDGLPDKDSAIRWIVEHTRTLAA